MAFEYLSGDRSQQFLLPPDMRDWLPADHLAWFVIDVMARLDLSAFEQRSDDPRGRRAYDPVVLATVLVYAYCVGERSSRRIERRCLEDIAFRVAAANLTPDHTTLSRFIRDRAEAFDSFFVQVLTVAAAAGMAKVGTIYIDGTKVAADASPLRAGPAPRSRPRFGVSPTRPAVPTSGRTARSGREPARSFPQTSLIPTPGERSWTQRWASSMTSRPDDGRTVSPASRRE